MGQDGEEDRAPTHERFVVGVDVARERGEDLVHDLRLPTDPFEKRFHAMYLSIYI
jgi:hypothetical protein